MSVKVKVHPFLRRFINDQEEIEVEGKTVGECINDVDRKFPGFKQQVVNSKGKLKDIYEVYVNYASAFPEELDKPVNDGDTVTIITYIAGG